jgi:hypothetical protein
MDKRIEEILKDYLSRHHLVHQDDYGLLMKKAYLLALSDVEKKANNLKNSIINEIEELNESDVDYEVHENNLRAESHGYGRIIYSIEELRKENQ